MPRILVIDDITEVRGFFRAALEQAGFEVHEAINGREGVRLFREQPTEAVITDVYMPDGDGLHVIRELRPHSPSVKIIAVSSTDAPDPLLHEARSLGADAILLKPIGVEELHQAVHRLIGPADSSFNASS
jgi:two-component system OmpR family response regulator